MMAGKLKLTKNLGFSNTKSRLIYLLTFFIALFSISSYIFISREIEEVISKSLEAKASFISQYALNSLKENEKKGEERNFNIEAVDFFKNYSLKYLVLYNQRGILQKSYNLEEAEKDFYLFAKQPSLLSNNHKTCRMQVSLTSGDSAGFKIYLGFPAEEYTAQIASSKQSAAEKFLLLFAGGTFFIIILINLVFIPFKKLLTGAEEYIKGNLIYRVKSSGKGQFGIIARALNSLSFNLSNANGQIENLNKQLKVLFRDKIGELNLEINQRRLAEHSLKQSEKQFRLLFERAPIGMVITSPEDKILKVNKAFCESLGFSEQELSDKKTFDLTFLDDQPDYIKLHNQLLEEDLSHIYFENRFVRKDKQIIFTIVESVLIRGEDEKPHHFLSQVIDITERKRVEKELVKAKEKAEESDRLKTAFLAQMSHEIRTPLNVILAATPILADELPEGNEENDILLDSITNAGKRLQRTIDMILNMSSVQSGNYVPEIEEIDLEKELRSLVDEFNSLIKNKEVDLNFFNSVREPFILADKYTVNQIFQNLIGNAVKYTPKGRIKVSIYEKDQFTACVEIKDSGIGMSREYMKKLFTPFSQEDIGYKREFEGNGLGLALVKKYVELNSASITADSIKDKGSVFTVFFKNLRWHRMNPANRVESQAAV